MSYDDENKVEGLVLLTDEAREFLNPREEIAYQEFRRSLAEWLLNLGKNPRKAEGYSYSTAKSRMNKIDLFYRWVWQDRERFVQDLSPEHADDWMRDLARRDMKESTKCHYQKAAKTLFKWQREARNRDVEWEPEIEYSDPSTAYQPREYLTEDDRQAMREAAMSYGSIPHYNSLEPSERRRWKSYLAQRLQKPVEQVGKKDFAQSLEVGEAVIQVGNQNPVPVQVDEYSLSKQVSDEELRKQQQQRWNKLRFEERQTTQRFKERLSDTDLAEKKQVPSDPQTIDLSKEGVRLLEDVVRNPFKPLTERYSAFSSSYKGNKAKNELVEQGVVIERSVKTGGQRKLLELTEKGRDHVEDSLDLEVKHRGRGGVVHRFWQHQIHDLFEEAGWQVFLEKFDADIYVNMGTTELAVEVATGDNPREIQHVEKHLDRDFQVWVACRNSEVRDGLQQRLEDNDVPSENVVFRLFREFNDDEHLPV